MVDIQWLDKQLEYFKFIQVLNCFSILKSLNEIGKKTQNFQFTSNGQWILENLKFLINVHCSQNLKKYYKHKHFQVWHLSPLGNYNINHLIPKNPTKWPSVFEPPNCFGESSCECIRRTLNFSISKWNHSQEYPH